MAASEFEKVTDFKVDNNASEVKENIAAGTKVSQLREALVNVRRQNVRAAEQNEAKIKFEKYEAEREGLWGKLGEALDSPNKRSHTRMQMDISDATYELLLICIALHKALRASKSQYSPLSTLLLPHKLLDYVINFIPKAKTEEGWSLNPYEMRERGKGFIEKLTGKTLDQQFADWRIRNSDFIENHQKTPLPKLEYDAKVMANGEVQRYMLTEGTKAPAEYLKYFDAVMVVWLESHDYSFDPMQKTFKNKTTNAPLTQADFDSLNNVKGETLSDFIKASLRVDCAHVSVKPPEPARTPSPISITPPTP